MVILGFVYCTINQPQNHHKWVAVCHIVCFIYMCIYIYIYSLKILQLLSGIAVSGIVTGLSMISNFVGIICGIEKKLYDYIHTYIYICYRPQDLPFCDL